MTSARGYAAARLELPADEPMDGPLKGELTPAPSARASMLNRGMDADDSATMLGSACEGASRSQSWASSALVEAQSVVQRVTKLP